MEIDFGRAKQRTTMSGMVVLDGGMLLHIDYAGRMLTIIKKEKII